MFRYLAFFVLLFSFCLNLYKNNNELNEETLILTIQLNNRQQIIHEFGASDAWSTQFVGKNWPLEKRQEMADLLFSSEMDANGNPRGIGLSIWRFNIGGGSAEQGVESGIEDQWRRGRSEERRVGRECGSRRQWGE